MPPDTEKAASHASRLLMLLALVFLAGLSVRLYGLGSQTLECEELYTLPAATGHQYVYLTGESDSADTQLPSTTSDYKNLLVPDRNKGLTDVTHVLRRNVHLPSYFYFMHYWVRAFGVSESSLRLPSAIFGALAVILIFLLGQELFSPMVGLIGAILMAFMPEQIHYSQQARMYPLLALLALASNYSIIRSRKHDSSKWPYVAFAVLSTAGLYTHYEYLFFFSAQLFYIWFASSLGKQRKRAWLGTNVLIIASFLPWVLIGLSQRHTSQEIIAWVHGPLSTAQVLTEIFSKTTRLVSVPEAPLGWLSVIVAYGLLLLGLYSLRRQRPTLLLLGAWIIFPLAGVLLLDYLLATRAIGIMRYWIIIAPALYLLIAAGVEKIKTRQIEIALVAVLTGFLLSTAFLTSRAELRAKPDRHKEMAQFIDSQISGNGNQIVLTEALNSIPLALGYYAQREMTILRYKWLTDQLRQRRLGDIAPGVTEIFLMVSGQSRAERLLEANGFRAEGKPVIYGHIVITKYVLDQALHEPLPLPSGVDNP